MALFTQKFAEERSELEIALRGVALPNTIKFEYHGCGKEKNEVREIQAYLLPVEGINDYTNGIFSIDGVISETPIGFVRKKHFLIKDYYSLKFGGDFEKVEKSDNRIYLPLVDVPEIFEVIGVTSDQGVFVPNKGSPFRILGLRESEEIRPLLLVSDSGSELWIKGFYLKSDGGVSLYNHSSKQDNKIREFLEAFYSGKPTLL